MSAAARADGSGGPGASPGAGADGFTMDFFGRQDRAKKNTVKLVVLFGLAVIIIMVLAYLVVATAWLLLQTKMESQAPGAADYFNPLLMLGTAGAVILLVGGASAHKLNELRGGGAYVATQLGGKPMNVSPTDLKEQQLLNVVEEMSIASGVPVPPVFIMEDEPGINAFAAGYAPSSAVIGVTRGAVERLSREEMQGVIAHEFSHILNGDMRLNVRLIGILFGILAIGLMGQMVLRSMRYAAYGTSSRRSSKDGGGGAAILVILAAALALLIIGYAGVFFGKLIKAGVSRQREYLADAAAVQFTRYPQGIAGALKKIGARSRKARLDAPRAEEMSHMFFGQAIKTMTGMFATHPPLEKRIRAIDPSWDGTFPELEPLRDRTKAQREPARDDQDEDQIPGWALEKELESVGLVGALEAVRQARAARQGGAAPTDQPRPKRFSPDEVAASVGRPGLAHEVIARHEIHAIPRFLRESAREAYGARAVVYALLLDSNARVRVKQLEHLEGSGDTAAFELTRQLFPLADRLEAGLRLPLLNIAIGSLRQMSITQHQGFRRNMQALIEADDRLSFFEWTLSRIVHHSLGPEFGGRAPRQSGSKTLATVKREARLLLSAVAWAGAGGDAEKARRAFAEGTAELGLADLDLLAFKDVSLRDLDAALPRFERLRGDDKRRLIKGLAAAALADEELWAAEAELLRAVCAALDCPLPRLVPGE